MPLSNQDYLRICSALVESQQFFLDTFFLFIAFLSYLFYMFILILFLVRILLISWYFLLYYCLLIIFVIILLWTNWSNLFYFIKVWPLSVKYSQDTSYVIKCLCRNQYKFSNFRYWIWIWIIGREDVLFIWVYFLIILSFSEGEPSGSWNGKMQLQGLDWYPIKFITYQSKL